ncbi:MAG: cache domain-containing protein [Candidatus Anammoxibacter sp.]
MGYLLKMFIAVIASYFIFFGIVGPSLFTKSVESLKNAIKNHLITVRELKKMELEGYFFERRGDLMVLSRDPLVVNGLPLFINAYNDKGLGSKQYIDAEREYGTKLTYYTKTYGYEDLFLVDIDGNIVFAAVDESYLGINLLEVDFIDPMIPDIFMQGREKIAFSDYVWFELFNELTAFGASPIRDRRGDVMGVLVFRLAFAQIGDIMSKRPGLGKTGETYIVGEDKLMRSNSRFVEGTTAYQLRVDTKAVREAMKGHSAVEIIDDYRGVPVVSAYSPLDIENFNWTIMAEIDVEEAFMSVFKLRKLMYIVGGLITVALGIYGYLAYRKEQRLIEEEEELEEKQEQEALGKETKKTVNKKDEGESKKAGK